MQVRFRRNFRGTILATGFRPVLHRGHMRRVLIVLLFLACGTYGGSGSRPRSPEPRVIEGLATRYSFDPSEITATLGEKLRILVRSGDGPHGFEIKKFKISKEIARGGD